jgi:hypothetical protein
MATTKQRSGRSSAERLSSALSVRVHRSGLPPIDEGDPGVTWCFRRGEQIPSDHAAAIEWPGFFFEVDD